MRDAREVKTNAFSDAVNKLSGSSAWTVFLCQDNDFFTVRANEIAVIEGDLLFLDHTDKIVLLVSRGLYESFVKVNG